MTVRDMHIELDQSTQLVAANLTRKWYPEEKDWVLNKIQQRFIRQQLRPKKDTLGNLTGGFELDQIGSDSIRMLVVTNHNLVPYIVDDKRYKCFLPANYSYMLSDNSSTKLICDATVEEPTASHTHYRTALRQEQCPIDHTSHYVTMQISLPDQVIDIPTDLPAFNDYVGLANKKDISFLVPWILWKTGWYWERYDELYKPSWYIQVQNTVPGSAGIIIEGVGIGDPGGVAYTAPITSTKTYTYHTAAGSQVNNRLSPTDVVGSLNQSSFFKTAYYSPLSELEGNLLWVYRDNSFIVSAVGISYVRKPQPISLSLNTDCELSEGVHQLICDQAVEYMQARVKDIQGASLSEADLAKRVIL